MKKISLYTLLLAVTFMTIAACGESEEERLAREQARQDSLRRAQQQQYAEQLAAMQDTTATTEEAEQKAEEVAPKYTLTENGHFVVQVGAWRSEEKAQNYVNKLSGRSYPTAYVVKTGDDATGDVWFRVRVGYLSTKSGAKIFGEELSKELNSGYWVANRD